jgi:DNA-binding beta-propeller fold protein YncE
MLPVNALASDVYVTSQNSGTVSPFSIDSNGALAPIACSTGCKTGSSPQGVAVSPNGRFLYVANSSSSTVSAFSIEADGALAPIACPTGCKTGAEPYWLAVSPNGEFLFVTNYGGRSVSPFSIEADGSLTPIACSTNCSAGIEPEGVAVSPNGRFLYVTNKGSEDISAFSIEANGSLMPIACSSNCETGDGPWAAAVSPNGRFLYVTNVLGQSVSPFSIEADGAPAPIACSTGCKTGGQPAGIAASPSGRFLYVADRESGAISPFSIEADGALTPITCSTGCKPGGEPVGIAASPSGDFLYTSSDNSAAVSPFSIEAGGLLTPITCATGCTTGGDSYTQSVAVSPDQAPTAAFTATPAVSGQPTSFNGSGSTASSGQSVASYEWSFGDGTTAQNAGPTPSHVYGAPGAYTVTLTVTDNAGCSTQPIYTGQTASCNGSSTATVSHTITVLAPTPPLIATPVAPTLSSVSQSTKTWREGTALAAISAAKKAKEPPLGTMFTFTLNESASVTFTFTQSVNGRKVGRTCVAQTSKNKSKRRCTRTVTAGTLTLSARAGASKVRFDGVLSKHAKLKPGSYTLLVTATASGKRSATRTLHFTIAR